MKSEDEIRQVLDRLKSDERLGYPPADVSINAPLALVQVALENKVAVLEWVLSSGDENKTPKKKKQINQR